MKKIIIVYYTRTGITEDIANKVAKKLGCDIYCIKDKKNRKGIVNYIKSGYEAMNDKLTDIEEMDIDIKEYDMVILGTPVWASNMVPAIRSFIEKYRNDFKEVSFIVTSAGGGNEKTIESLTTITKSPIGVLSLNSKDIKNDLVKRINDFCKVIKE